jgi:hypothetical protein
VDRPAISEDMSRGEMIRRLDESSKGLREQLTRGPLTADERRVLAAGLVRLLSIVADSLQDQEDRQAVAGLLTEAGQMSRRDRAAFTAQVGAEFPRPFQPPVHG